MNIPVFWFQGAAQWDTALPKYILDRAARNCIHYPDARPMKADVGVIVIPGRHSAKPENYGALNQSAEGLKRVVFVVIGDEESLFQTDELQHPNAKIWYLMPPFNPKQRVDRVGPNGWPTGAIEMIAAAKKFSPNDERPYDWHFMGQKTHSRRVECLDAAEGIPKGRCLATEGFTQGESRDSYYVSMIRSKLVLCPSGPCTPDSFRFAEALESGAVPIVDDLTPNPNYPEGYWKYVFDAKTLPFPLITNWDTLPEVMEECLAHWEEMSIECMAWWTFQKAKLVMEMREDLGL